MLDYLSVTEVIETIDDLVQFVKDLSPCLSKVKKKPANIVNLWLVTICIFPGLPVFSGD